VLVRNNGEGKRTRPVAVRLGQPSPALLRRGGRSTPSCSATANCFPDGFPATDLGLAESRKVGPDVLLLIYDPASLA